MGLFHLEVLLMAFHSSNAFEKIKMAENIFSTLSNVSCPPVELNSTQLVCWSLLTARNIHTNPINQAKTALIFFLPSVQDNSDMF